MEICKYEHTKPSNKTFLRHDYLRNLKYIYIPYFVSLALIILFYNSFRVRLLHYNNIHVYDPFQICIVLFRLTYISGSQLWKFKLIGALITHVIIQKFYTREVAPRGAFYWYAPYICKTHTQYINNIIIYIQTGYII